MNPMDEPTAVVLVDPYKEVLSEGGRAWPRLREVAEAVGTHQGLRTLLTAARAASLPIVIAPHRRWRPGDGEGWQVPGPPHLSLARNRLFEAAGFGGEWHPEFGPQQGDIVAYEHWGMSGFTHTDLDLHLRQHGIRHIVLAGMTAIGCVEGTGRQAVELGYHVTLVSDATAAFTHEGLHAAHHINGPLYASAIVTAAEFAAAL